MGVVDDRSADLAAVEAARAGDAAAFAGLVEPHRGELRVHCYRMLGSFDEAEDLVQETFLLAWRGFAGFTATGRWSVRAWLYRIATNACLNVLTRTPRRVLPAQLGPAGDPHLPLRPPVDHPWLQPFPDQMLPEIPSADAGPEATAVSRETIELAFLASIQLLPPRQRAALILRDVLGWPARDVAAAIEQSVASVNSALQRARATLQEHLPQRRIEWGPVSEPTDEERQVLSRYMAAHENSDAAELARVLSADVRGSMPPHVTWFEGRAAVLVASRKGFDPASPQYTGRLRTVATRANGQPAAACYAWDEAAGEFRAFSLDVLRVIDGEITEIVSFGPDRFPSFDLPVVAPDR
ncbi:RNA polymerase subunit sigma-70 [Pseudonocardia sp. TRM90224]|uniref:RNA polymerase subunit sigma-70 n=1 Tax=Pseudonocardia sp. TRM90224 TaxID=2812678 RepID=UPI001E49D1A7|nr:RNA polymerase subunit sigma-70 [Pseudonocardia sp. TRM90224]